ncbi:preprotein translocase subunit SecE [Candidatus Peregrinibacteria bacterium]|nr:preprotein translocase subunit SecE [Candidatus Peregrinibacteria bacterium]
MSEKKTNPVIEYAQESVMELKRVTWPTSKQAVKLAVIVLGFCLAAAVFVGLADWIFNTGYAQLLDFAARR